MDAEIDLDEFSAWVNIPTAAIAAVAPENLIRDDPRVSVW